MHVIGLSALSCSSAKLWCLGWW